MLMALISESSKTYSQLTRKCLSPMDFLTNKDGKLVEHWVNADIPGLMQQIGAIPSPSSADSSKARY